MKIDKALNIVLILLGITAVCLVAFAGIRSNQHRSKQENIYTKSSKASDVKKSSSKTTVSSENEQGGLSSESGQLSEKHKDRPNAGKSSNLIALKQQKRR